MAEIRRFNPSDRAGPDPYCGERRLPQRTAAAFRDGRDKEFDAIAWMAIVEEQKLMIARAAGVDPAKVRIQIGH